MKVQTLGHKPRHKEGYFPLPPVDSMHDVRTEMVMTMQDIGYNSRSTSS